MSWRAKMKVVLTILCMLCVVSFAACGSVTAAAGQNGQDAPALRVAFAKPGVVAPFATTVHDAQAVTRLYRAALALPHPRPGVYNCPEDDGGVYHLTFSGGQMKVHHMNLNASGCRFLTFTDVNQTRYMDDGFVSLFTKTVGLPSLDPSFP